MGDQLAINDGLHILEIGTHVPTHRHLKTTEAMICMDGCLDWMFYEELPSMASRSDYELICPRGVRLKTYEKYLIQ